MGLAFHRDASYYVRVSSGQDPSEIPERPDHLAPKSPADSPVQRAGVWLQYAWTGQFGSLWPLTSDVMRRTLAERWVQDRIAEGTASAQDSASLVLALSSEIPDHPRAREFAQTMLDSTKETFISGGIAEDWAWSPPHVLDEQHTVVTLSAGGEGRRDAGSYPGMHFIMERDPHIGWLVGELKPGVVEVDPRRAHTEFAPIKQVLW
jgi:hypothetical protein